MSSNATIRPQQIEQAKKLLQNLPEKENRKTRPEAAGGGAAGIGQVLPGEKGQAPLGEDRQGAALRLPGLLRPQEQV